MIEVRANEPVPCDLVLVSSADPSGECTVTTAALDGETNLKVLLQCYLAFALYFYFYFYLKITHTPTTF